jgi:hypothetical protein
MSPKQLFTTKHNWGTLKRPSIRIWDGPWRWKKINLDNNSEYDFTKPQDLNLAERGHNCSKSIQGSDQVCIAILTLVARRVFTFHEFINYPFCGLSCIPATSTYFLTVL